MKDNYPNYLKGKLTGGGHQSGSYEFSSYPLLISSNPLLKGRGIQTGSEEFSSRNLPEALEGRGKPLNTKDKLTQHYENINNTHEY